MLRDAYFIFESVLVNIAIGVIIDWTGPNCDIQTDYCWCSPCLNGGTCKDGNMTYTCTCLSDYAGQDCELSLPTLTTTTDLHTIANSTTKTTTALYTIANLTRTTTALHTNANPTTRTTALHTTTNTTTRITNALHTNANSTTMTTIALHTTTNTTTRITNAQHTNANSTTMTTIALHTTTNTTTRTTTALHTKTNSTTSTATAIHTNANSTTRTTNALHNNDNLTTTTTTATIQLSSMTQFQKTFMLKNSLMNATLVQIFTRLPNVTTTLSPVLQSGMHITFNTTNIILQNDRQKWSPTIRINNVTISEAMAPTVSIHKYPDVMTLLPIVGGAIAGTGVLLALCGLLTSFIKRRQNMMAELHKNNEDTRKLAWT